MPRGRPRDFDTGQAMHDVMTAFWTHGFQGTSITELEQRTGLGRTSLYAAFGDKHAMFVHALTHYWQERMERTNAVLRAAPTARDGIAALLGKVVANLSSSAQPPGCLRVNSVLEMGCLDGSAAEALQRMQSDLERAVLDRLRSGYDGDGRAIARFVVAVINGLAVSARMGASRAELDGVATLALTSLPDTT